MDSLIAALHPWLPLIGVPIVVAGFALGFNALLVVVVAGLATGLAAGMAPATLLETFGEKFLSSRSVTIFVLILPVIGLLERHGLQERAQAWVAGVRRASSARILSLYFVLRQLSGAVGLISLAGHAQTVRPLLAPMVLGAAQARYGPLPERWAERLRAHAAACENVAIFFSEDIFLAFGAVLLIDAFLKDNGITGIEPLTLGLWALPTALVALVVHLVRVARLERQLQRELAAQEKVE
jgi:uncharacterized membrane protein